MTAAVADVESFMIRGSYDVLVVYPRWRFKCCLYQAWAVTTGCVGSRMVKIQIFVGFVVG